MEYRTLPRGRERIGVLGVGAGGIQNNTDDGIEKIVSAALENGINFFDLCAGAKNVYAPFGRAIAGQRDKVMFQLHFGAVYNEKGEYGWSRELDRIKSAFSWELRAIGTDYADFGLLHCVDEENDFEEIISSGILDFVLEQKKRGKVRHIGFSSHTPSVARRMLDEVPDIDLIMFSINPAYDLEQGGELGIGTNKERAELLRKCEATGVGVSVMKPFHGGKLLDARTSPFGIGMTRAQCIRYALDRPGVLTVLPGVRDIDDLKTLLSDIDAPRNEEDYSFISRFTPAAAVGNCVYCNHCLPCPAGIDVGLVNKYYDLALAGDRMAANHYDKLSVKADACLGCGHCVTRCPFKVRQSARMKEIAEYFKDHQETAMR